jgi:hypothetical protein
VLACADENGVAPLAPRPGAARKITDEQVEVLVTRTLTEKGRGQDSHWSIRAMAAETGLSQSSVSRIWRALGLTPSGLSMVGSGRQVMGWPSTEPMLPIPAVLGDWRGCVI